MSNTNNQKKEWAKLLFTKEACTQSEIAEKVGVSRQTVSKWVKNEKWDKLKVSLSMTRETSLAGLYNQLVEINEAISSKPKGERFADSKESNTITQLTTSIKKLENDTDLAACTAVFSELIKWARINQPEKVDTLWPILDTFIESKL